MTALTWTEVVTTALLGTDRRPLPAGLRGAREGEAEETPAPVVLLDLAARHRARRQAAPTLPHCPAPPVAPRADLPDAPPAAQQLLGELLSRPLAELVNAWLAAAADHGVRAAPEHWTELAALAAYRPDYHRDLLAAALGGQGSWFLDQNAAWQRLAEAVRDELSGAPQRSDAGRARPDDRAAEPRPALPGIAELRVRPEAAFEVPAPWPRSLSVSALQVLLEGGLGWRAPRYGAALGARLATADADLLGQAVEALPDGPRGGTPGVRLVHDALAAVERSLAARTEIARAFDSAPATERATPDDSGGPR